MVVDEQAVIVTGSPELAIRMAFGPGPRVGDILPPGCVPEGQVMRFERYQGAFAIRGAPGG